MINIIIPAVGYYLFTNYSGNPFTTIHDGNFRRHSSMYVTIHYGNFHQIYYSYTRIPGSWYALRPGSEEVKSIFLVFFGYDPSTTHFNPPFLLKNVKLEVAMCQNEQFMVLFSNCK